MRLVATSPMRAHDLLPSISYFLLCAIPLLYVITEQPPLPS